MLYGWFFYIDPLLEEEQLGPEELEGYREELGAWVRDNEERLRQVHHRQQRSSLFMTQQIYWPKAFKRMAVEMCDRVVKWKQSAP